MTALNPEALAAACKAALSEMSDRSLLNGVGRDLWQEIGEAVATAAIEALQATKPDAVAVERAEIRAESAQQYGSLQVNAASQVELDKDKVFWSDDGSIWCHIANLYDLAIRSQP